MAEHEPVPRLVPDPHNLAFAEELYARFLADPATVDESWRRAFSELAASDGDRVAAQKAVDGPSFRRASIFAPPGGAAPGRAPAEAASLGTLAVPEVAAGELEERLRFVRGVKLFRSLPEEELGIVARFATRERFADRATVLREGEVGDCLYLVTDGQLLVRRKDQVVAALGPGDVVGELSVLDAQPRSADVVAHGAVAALRIGRDELLALIERRPLLARGFIDMLASRLRQRSSRQDKVNQLIHAYRVRGHLRAALDPLGRPRPPVRELELEHWGLSERDLDSLFSSTGIAADAEVMTLREILALLESTYCRSIGVQYMHIDDVDAKRWILERVENPRHHRRLEREEQLRILTKLTDAEIFEQFVHTKFLGAKRFSLEGAETLIPLLDLALDEAGAQGVEEVVIGMAHRGRLNVLVNVLGKSPAAIFREFQDVEGERLKGRGDVKYHMGFSAERETYSGHRLGLSLCFNPSHLEFVDPVAIGRVRAKQDRHGDVERRGSMAILIHGDAAMAGQGVLQEIFNLSGLAGYTTGGTLHVVVNNQIGFTTPPEEGRSTIYATDVARMLQTPIFHVDGENPEAVAHVVRIAMDYRRDFRKDVVLDMYCYRRYGHNEGDEPAYTQPVLYEAIRRRKSVREGYLDHLSTLGGVSEADAEEIAAARREHLELQLSESKSAKAELRGPTSTEGRWRAYRGGFDAEVPETPTAVDRRLLSTLLTKSVEVPAGFHLNPKLKRFAEARREMAAGERALDWGSAEIAAFASLLVEGTPVRLTGQDCERGTFSHRHAVFHDVVDGREHLPLRHLTSDQGRVEIRDSPLSEIAVLGFEYGYSLDTPEGLTLWEAQFGDFSNVAQVIIDQFITSSEDKWNRLSGLVMLLPHGFEGQGPEHSSARLERFLQLAGEDNIQVVNLSTPAQYFHCLRRQVLRPLRKPLVVMSPKSLLRAAAAVSSLDELASGRFHRLLADGKKIAAKKVRKVLLASGKLAHELEAAREERRVTDVAIVRLEQYYPLETDALAEALERYPKGTPAVWVQEEPSNMGAWGFLRLRLGDAIAARWPFSGVTRAESASPATGSKAAHDQEQRELIESAFA